MPDEVCVRKTICTEKDAVSAAAAVVAAAAAEGDCRDCSSSSFGFY